MFLDILDFLDFFVFSPTWLLGRVGLSRSRHVRVCVGVSVCLRHPAPQGARLLVKVEGLSLPSDHMTRSRVKRVGVSCMQGFFSQTFGD